MFQTKENYSIADLLAIMRLLRGENGCPWDKEQTHESLAPLLLEESQEVIEAIKNADMENLKEELGDVLLHVFFHAKLAQKAGAFDFTDVVAGLCEKLKRRHTHIFGGDKAETIEEVMRIWEKNKQNEKKC